MKWSNVLSHIPKAPAWRYRRTRCLNLHAHKAKRKYIKGLTLLEMEGSYTYTPEVPLLANMEEENGPLEDYFPLRSRG